MKFLNVLLLLVVFVSTVVRAEDNNANEPEWLFNLVFDDVKYMYGVAKNYTADKQGSIHYARVNAVKNWALSEGLPVPNITSDLSESFSFKIGEEILYFKASYQNKSGTYALITNQTKQRDFVATPVSQCDIKACQPGWLCGVKQDKLNLLSFSALTAHPNDQLRYLIENGQQLASMLNRAKVSGETRSLTIVDGLVNHNSLHEVYKVQTSEESMHAVKVKSTCNFGAGLIGLIELDFDTNYHKYNWLHEPNYNEIIGVVGYAIGTTSSGRLSDLVKVAVKRGLFDLAKAKKISVTGDVELEYNQQGQFSLVRESIQKTESIVSAYIADMKMELNKKYQPIINVWLLENKGKI